MRRGSAVFCLLWGFICAAPTLADDEEKDAKKAEAKEADSKEKLTPAGSFVGKLTRVEGSQKYLTVQITIPVPTLSHQGYGRGRHHGLPSIHYHNITQTIELQASDDMKVRIMQPPVDFDEKGKPKKYTYKELQDLKGPDKKLPGYQADFDSLKAEQIVKVYLGKKKDAPKPVARVKLKGKDQDFDVPALDKPEATMVVIISEPRK